MLLFFHRLKCGRYGRFYGSVDALFITASLGEFMRERKSDIVYLEEERRRREQSAKPERTGITYEEYERRKALKEQNQQKRPADEEQ